MIRSLDKLFSLQADTQEDLFGFSGDQHIDLYQYEKSDIEFLTAYFYGKIDVSKLAGNARILFEISTSIFDTIIHAWLSELPIEKELSVFCKKIIASPADAWKISQDRTDPDTLTVLNTSAKVYHEVHRMMELLRFTPDDEGVFIAKCEPDHFVLPAMAVYFTARFGETSWAIIDEKRGLCLSFRGSEEAPAMKFPARISLKTESVNIVKSNDEWEGLWKHYHKTINNEDRNNPNLQRQFMPVRYWKYLPEKRE